MLSRLFNGIGRTRAFIKNRRAISSGAIVSIAVSLILVAALVPTAITLFTNANTTGWDPSVVAVWGIIPIMAIVGLVLLFIVMRGSKA